MPNADLPHSSPNQPPEEERLVALLESLRPRPSSRFYRRMASAPWRTAVQETRSSRWGRLRFLPAGAVLLALIVLFVIAFPPLNATARRLMSFFIPSPSKTLELKVTAPSPADPNVFGSPGYFNLTLPEAEHLAGFRVQQIPIQKADKLIPGLELAGAHYDSDLHAVILRYSMDSHSLFLTQRKLGMIEEYNTIGPGAPVEQVSVRGVMGEYVTGGWKTRETPAASPQPGTKGVDVTLDVTWDPNLPQHILRWQEGAFLYELLATAGLGREIDLEKEQLIKIAELIQ